MGKIGYKKAVKCLDGTYVEGTSSGLCSTIYRYDADFSDKAIQEVIEFARAVQDTRTVKILTWLLESREEKKNNQIDLGQMKIDAYLDQAIESDTRDGYTCEVKKDKDIDSVVITLTWYDADIQDYITAAGTFTLDEFLHFSIDSFNATLGEIRAYGILG